MARRGIRSSLFLAFALIVSLASLALAAGNGSGGKPTPGEEVGNNLSYPAMFYGAPAQTGVIGSYTLSGTFPSSLSWGCAKPEVIGTTTFPNTSCVDDAAAVVTPVTPQACVAPGGKCEGFEYVTDVDDPTIPNLERIYWQKTALNAWQAGYAGVTTPLIVDYVDWGDNLESRTWPAQVIRVETNTFQQLLTPMVRYEVWHVFGSGTNELWGVHATGVGTPQPYVYTAWSYAVNVAPAARLNISKLVNGPASCPTAPGWTPPAAPTWNLATRWELWELSDAPYTAELNIKGSYVYGYNWNLRSAVVPPSVGKGGWWRLTFYTPDNSVDFSHWLPPTLDNNTLAPPLSTLTPSPMVALPAAEAEEGDTGALYRPVVDLVNHLTYIDLCISATKGGGKK